MVFLASKVMESEHPANLTESPNVEKGTAVYFKVETDSLDPAEQQEAQDDLEARHDF